MHFAKFQSKGKNNEKWLLLLIGCAVVSFANSVSEKLTQDCDLNDYVACYNLGVLYYKGQEVEKNHKKALDFTLKLVI